MPKIKVKTLRFLTATAVVLLVVLGAAYKVGFGTLSSLGTATISYLCPLGFLEASLASRTWLPRAWISITVVVLSIVLFGRFFCAWICPTSLLKEIFKPNKNKPKTKIQAENTPAASALNAPISNQAKPPVAQSTLPFKSFDSRYLVLGGALVSSFLFGFPVFCLICPIGLFFGSIFAVIRLFSIQQPSLELLLFPALLGIELFALKSWCRSICPLGALFSLISNLNGFFRPVVKTERCLTAKGINCQVCQKACPEGINLHNPKGTAALNDCIKCLECSERCPVKAIKFPVRG